MGRVSSQAIPVLRSMGVVLWAYMCRWQTRFVLQRTGPRCCGKASWASREGYKINSTKDKLSHEGIQLYESLIVIHIDIGFI